MDPNAVVEAFRHTVTEHYLDFAGRCGRREFWHYVLAYVAGYIVLAIVQRIFGMHFLTALYSLGLLLPGIGISVRRLHDTGRSGWWFLIAVPAGLKAILSTMAHTAASSSILSAIFLPIVALGALALLIYWYAQPGNPGSNQYGPPPADTATPSTAT